MAINKDVTVYIGRFSPFHNGHAHVLQRALETSTQVIVLIGSAFKARSPKNPFTYDERRLMLTWWYDELVNSNRDKKFGELTILPIMDQASNNVWIKAVQATVRQALKVRAGQHTPKKIYLTGSDRDDSTWYLNAFPQWTLDLVPAIQHAPNTPADLSATSVRKALFENELTFENIKSLIVKVPETTLEFLEDFTLRARWGEQELIDGKRPIDWLREQHRVIQASRAKWTNTPYPVQFITADAVIIQSGHVLVVRRGNQPGKGLIALPGGYVNQSERIKDAAIREAMEETGIQLATGKKADEITERMLRGSIRASEIFDDPNRSERGRIVTIAYLFRLDDTKPLPAVSGQNVPFYEANGQVEVETLEAFWMPLDQALDDPTQWFEDHHQIISHFTFMVD